jgi:hypothetical protein
MMIPFKVEIHAQHNPDNAHIQRALHSMPRHCTAGTRLLVARAKRDGPAEALLLTLIFPIL